LGIINLTICIFLIFKSCLAFADIYGADNRVQVYEGDSSRVHRKSPAVAVGVLNSLWERNKDNSFRLEYIEDRIHGLCKSEKFSDDPSVPYACTGFLVGPDLLVTAGHCSVNSGEIFNSTDDYCEAYTWLFDYQFKRGEELDLVNIDEDRVYKCKKIIYATFDGAKDFALIQLDRPALSRPYLELSKKELRSGERVNVLGYPTGMPLKRAPGRVLEKNEDLYIINADAMAGNSGSPVLNNKNEVIGVLIGGRPNEIFYEDKKNRCNRFNRCNNRGQNCRAGNEENLPFPHTGIEVFRFDQFYDIKNFTKLNSADRVEPLSRVHPFNPYKPFQH